MQRSLQNVYNVAHEARKTMFGSQVNVSYLLNGANSRLGGHAGALEASPIGAPRSRFCVVVSDAQSTFDDFVNPRKHDFRESEAPFSTLRNDVRCAHALVSTVLVLSH